MPRTTAAVACDVFAVVAVAILRPAARAREWRTDHPHQPRRHHDPDHRRDGPRMRRAAH